MPEIAESFKGQTEAAKHFLLAAITQYTRTHLDGITSFEFPLNIVLTVNGIELNFDMTMANVYQRIKAQYEKPPITNVEDTIAIATLIGMSYDEIQELTAPPDDMVLQHFYNFCFQDEVNTASIAMSTPTKRVDQSMLNAARKKAGVVAGSALIACSYLGLFSTPKETQCQQTEQDQ